ncbi:MAG: hypothetical protein ACXWKO_07115 [Phenylobacterium sp.]
MTRRVKTWAPVAITVAAGALLTGADPVAPGPFPPLPVPPVERGSMPPYFARITISGDAKMSGVFEECMDPAATFKAARERSKARPADAPPPLTGCTNSHEMRPDGAIHTEMRCDQAKGAKASFRRTSDGTLNEVRSHVEWFDAGTRKTTVIDSHMVRLGPCPPDLKPGQRRRPGGPVIEPGKTPRLLDGPQGAGG